MRCPKCGKPLKEDTKFCMFCGTKIDNIVSNKDEKVTANINNKGAEEQRKQNRSILLWIGVAVGFLVLLIISINMNNYNPLEGKWRGRAFSFGYSYSPEEVTMVIDEERIYVYYEYGVESGKYRAEDGKLYVMIPDWYGDSFIYDYEIYGDTLELTYGDEDDIETTYFKRRK